METIEIRLKDINNRQGAIYTIKISLNGTVYVYRGVHSIAHGTTDQMSWFIAGIQSTLS